MIYWDITVFVPQMATLTQEKQCTKNVFNHQNCGCLLGDLWCVCVEPIMIDEPILCMCFPCFSLLIISWDIGQAMFPQSVGTPTYHSDPILNMMCISRMASWRNTGNTPSVHDRSANMMAHGKKKYSSHKDQIKDR